MKSIFSGQTIQDFDPNNDIADFDRGTSFSRRSRIKEIYKSASEYRINETNEYFCQHILDDFSPNQQLCVVNSMSVAWAGSGCTCPV